MNDLPADARQAAYSARCGSLVSQDAEAEMIEETARLFLDNQDPEGMAAIIAVETQVKFDFEFKGERPARISATTAISKRYFADQGRGPGVGCASRAGVPPRQGAAEADWAYRVL